MRESCHNAFFSELRMGIRLCGIVRPSVEWRTFSAPEFWEALFPGLKAFAVTFRPFGPAAFRVANRAWTMTECPFGAASVPGLEWGNSPTSPATNLSPKGSNVKAKAFTPGWNRPSKSGALKVRYITRGGHECLIR